MIRLDTYSPSGRVMWSRAWRIPLFGVLLIAMFSWAYANVLLFDPPFYFAPLATLIFAAMCTMTASALLEKTHSRSPRFSVAVAAGLALLALWIRWLVIFRAQGVPIAVEFATGNPFSSMAMIWNFGVRRAAMDHSAYSPFTSALFWCLEGACVAGLSVVAALGQARKPYSERLGTWSTEEPGGEVYAGSTSLDALRRQIAATGVDAFLGMARADRLAATPVASAWSTLKIKGYFVDGDTDAHWLTLSEVKSHRTTEGKVKSAEETLLEHWHVPAETYQQVMAYLHDTDEVVNDTHAAANEALSQDRPAPDALQPALSALQSENFASAITLAEGYQTHPDDTVRADAIRIVAFARSQLAQWLSAYDAFFDLFELEPTAHNALQLATTSVMVNQLVRGQAWLERAQQINVQTHEMQAPRLRTAYLSALEQAGEFEACESHLTWLRSCYEGVSNTDAQLLWNYGLPLFDEFLRKSGDLLSHSLDVEQLRTWCESMKRHVDDNGQVAINAHLAGLTKPLPKP